MREAVHMQITTIGLDIAKNVFQVHGIDAAKTVVVRKRLRRSQVLALFKALPPRSRRLDAITRELGEMLEEFRNLPCGVTWSISPLA
jgi:transposase